jgi:primary-amine oxidase
MPSPHPHPLKELTEADILIAREVIISHVGSSDAIFFRTIHLNEPLKNDLLPFLQAEHDGTLSEETPRPARIAFVEYDKVQPGKVEFTQAKVDVQSKKLLTNDVMKPTAQPAFTV